MRLIIVFIILISCTSNSSDKVLEKNNFNVKNISFNEFKNNMINYAKNADYPNINE